MNIKLPELDKTKLTNCDDVYAIMQKVLLRDNKIDRDKEHFWIVGLAENNLLLFVELNTLGNVNSTTVNPMNVFRVALIKNATKVIVVHNHPAGDVQPSENDKEVTDRLIQSGRILNVQVVEHMIITPTTYYSFRNSGLFEMLENSLKWVPSAEAVQKVRDEERMFRAMLIEEAKNHGEKEGLEKGIEVGEKRGMEKGKKSGIKKGKKEGKIEMAKSLKEDGIDIAAIIKASGLSRKEIERL